jgi:transketolase
MVLSMVLFFLLALKSFKKYSMTTEIKELEQIASQIRRDILRMTNGAKSGHPGGSLGCTDVFTVLFFQFLKLNPERFTMDGTGEDLFFLSNGHISPVFYSTLARRGYFPVSELSTFRKLDSRLQGHPTPAEELPGIRIASGSLGQGVSVAIGSALSKKLNKDNSLVVVLHGDGEMQEGQIWEAYMFAAHHKVDNLITIVDFNNKQIDGSVSDVISLGSIKEKLKSFGSEVIEMNGNNITDIIEKLQLAKQATGNGKPVAVVMQTIMSKGVDFMENDHKWHGVPPNDEQLKLALGQIKETIGDY